MIPVEKNSKQKQAANNKNQWNTEKMECAVSTGNRAKRIDTEEMGG
jgi:hypothetical protein